MIYYSLPLETKQTLSQKVKNSAEKFPVQTEKVFHIFHDAQELLNTRRNKFLSFFCEMPPIT